MATRATTTHAPRKRRSKKRTIKVYGRYIVADSAVCHGALTFRGTRIFVRDVLSQVAEGLSWESISDSWRGSVKREAIAEAVRLAQEALFGDGFDPVVDPVVEARSIVETVER